MRGGPSAKTKSNSMPMQEFCLSKVFRHNNSCLACLGHKFRMQNADNWHSSPCQRQVFPCFPVSAAQPVGKCIPLFPFPPSPTVLHSIVMFSRSLSQAQCSNATAPPPRSCFLDFRGSRHSGR